MKKLSIAALFIAALAISACHYGQEEAKKTLERNEQYKSDKAEYSVNRAGEGGVKEKTVDTTTATPVETKITAPVGQH